MLLWDLLTYFFICKDDNNTTILKHDPFGKFTHKSFLSAIVSDLRCDFHPPWSGKVLLPENRRLLGRLWL